MKYALDTVITNLDATPIKSPTGEAITFKTVCVACLVQAQDAASEDKYACFKLAVKIETAKEAVELAAEEVARLKRLIGATMPVVIVGRMFEALDQT